MTQQLAPFAVGPLVGESGTDHCRVFMSLPANTLDCGEKAYYGWIRWRPASATQWSTPLQFRLNGNFDSSAVVVIRQLQSATVYRFQSGWVVDGEAGALDWSQLTEGQFRTDDPGAESTRFLFGSCCYRRTGFDGKLEDDRADKIFYEMGKWADEQSPDFIFYAGDQIYADPTHRLGAAKYLEQYYHLYRCSFAQPHMAALLRRYNHYMILDDHEIEDNWPVRANPELWTSKYPAAIKAYQVYQASHSPAMVLDDEGRYLDRDPDHFWYQFQRGPADFFVMDVRTERVLGSWPWQRKMISEQQMAAIEQWLAVRPDRVKVLISSVLLFPEQRRPFKGCDSWQGFHYQRDQLLNLLAQTPANKLVVLSGDVHASFYAELQLRGGKRLHSWTCSGLFWPVSLLMFRHYQRMLRSDAPLRAIHGFSKGRVRIPGQVYSRDGFSQVEFDQDGATFTLVDRRGVVQPQVGKQVRW